MGLSTSSWMLPPLLHLGCQPRCEMEHSVNSIPSPDRFSCDYPLDSILMTSQIQHVRFQLILFLPSPRCVPPPSSYLVNGTTIFPSVPARHLKVILDSFFPYILSIWSYLWIFFRNSFLMSPLIHLSHQCSSWRLTQTLQCLPKWSPCFTSVFTRPREQLKMQNLPYVTPLPPILDVSPLQ